MQLLIDEAFEMDTEVVTELNEASGSKQQNYYIHGTFSTPDKKNRNGRVYSSKLWENNVEKYQQQITENTKNTLGELEHPTRVEVDPMKAVMKIVSLKMEDGVVKGRAKILNDNSPETNKLKALIDEGIKIGVSSRGTGRMKGSIVEEFQLSTYDIVQSPSDYNAMLSGISESTESLVHLNESTGQYVCDETGCSLQDNITEGTGSGDVAQTPCSQKAEALIKSLNEYVNPTIISNTEKLAQSLLNISERKKVDYKEIEQMIKDAKQKIKDSLEAGAMYGNVNKLEKELKDMLTYLKDTGIMEDSTAVMADKLLAMMNSTKEQHDFQRKYGSVYKMSAKELEKHTKDLGGDI